MPRHPPPSASPAGPAPEEFCDPNPPPPFPAGPQEAAEAPPAPAAHPCTPGLYFLLFQGVPGLCSAGWGGCRCWCGELLAATPRLPESR